LLAVYIIWGSTYLANRMALQSFPPVLMSAFRFFIAGGVLYITLRARGITAPTRREWAGAAVVGILLPAVGSGGAAFAQQWIASGLAAIVMATIPLWTSLFAGLAGRGPNRSEGVVLLLGLAGVSLLHMEGGLRTSPWGVGVLLLAAVSWGVGSVWSQKLSLPSAAMATAAQLLSAGVFLFILSAAFGERMTALPARPALLALAYLVVFGSLVGYGAYTYLLRAVRPALATSYAYVNPLVAVPLGTAVAGEHISRLGWMAMAIMLASVAALTRQEPRAVRSTPVGVTPRRGPARSARSALLRRAG
jgi:drug/metabolite transporter (DMT)-like permease